MPAYLGKYYDATKAGKVFIGNTATAGTAFPLATGTAMTFGLWNVTANKNAVLLGFQANFTSGTIALGGVGLTIINAGFALGTPISAFTDGTLGTTIRAGLMGQAGPGSRFTPSAATIAAATPGYWMGSSFGAAVGTPTDGLFVGIQHDFDGRVILPPGWAAFVVGSIAQTGLFSMSLSWAEVDV